MKTLSPALIYTLIVSLGGFIFGFDASVISGTVGFVSREFDLTTWQQGMVVSAPTLGGILAMLVAGAISDAIGRRKTLIIIALLYVFSALASALASSFEMLVLARFIGGLAFCSLMIAPIYIAEISAPEQRGRMVSINQLNIVFGFSVSYFSNYFLLQCSQSGAEWVSNIALDTQTWRWMLGLELIPAIAWFVLLFRIPRSPRWLMMTNQTEEARKVLATDLAESEVEEKLSTIRHSLDGQTPPLSERIRALGAKSMRWPLFIGLILAIAQQATGINVIFFYAPTIFEQSGVGTNAAFVQATWIGVVNVIFTLVAMYIIDRGGRKPLLVIGLSGIVLSMALCAYGFKQATYQLSEAAITEFVQSNPGVEPEHFAALQTQVYGSDIEFKQALQMHLGEAAAKIHEGELLRLAGSMNSTLILIGITAFVASFAMSLGPVMWVMFSEIFPNHVRGVAISLVSVINGLVSFLTQLVFPWELANLGAAYTFAVFGLFALVGLIFVLRYLPETKGRTLEEMQQAFK